MADYWGTLKARSFFGCMTIRNGLFLIALIQIITGVALFLCYGYLRPSLHAVSWSQLLIFTGSAFFGVWGAWRRNQTVEGIYFATFLVNIAFLLLAVLDFVDVVHMMPKAPPGATTSFLLVDHGGHPPVLEFVQQDKVLYKDQLPDPDRLLTNIHHRFSMTFVKTSPEEIKNKVQETLEVMPFEGESEEVSEDELPPESKNLSKAELDTITAITKMQKRPVKLAFGAIFGSLFFLHLYFSWIILTFLVNKCMSLDEITGQPEQ